MYQNLTNLLQQKGLKKQWLAEQLGISKARLSSYITGKRAMPDHLKIYTAKILKSSVGHLFFEEDVISVCDTKDIA